MSEGPTDDCVDVSLKYDGCRERKNEAGKLDYGSKEVLPIINLKYGFAYEK